MSGRVLGAVVLGYLTAINLALLIVMGADKRFAIRKRWRVPEATLFALAVLGGSVGGLLGMLLFRHKTRKTAFVIGFPLILLLHLALAWLLLSQGVIHIVV